MGPPASGKGTQAEMIRAEFKIEAPSVGAILREQAAARTKIGLEAEKFTREGRLVPDETIVAVVETWLEKHNGAFVFDGFPRTLGQGEAFERLLNKRGTPLELAISLEADTETIQDRVSKRMVCTACGFIVRVGWHVENMDAPCPRCGAVLHRRTDDTLDALQQRMAEYHEKSEPLIEFYAARNLVLRVPAQGRPEAVFSEIAAALAN